MKQLTKRKKQLLIVILSYLVIVSIRLVFLATHFYFGQDEARDILLMEQKIGQREWIVSYGPKASVGDFYLAPFYYQLHLVMTAVFGTHPLVMHVVTLLVESFTPLLLYAALALVFKRSAALVGAATYAISFQPLAASVNAWNPNMVVICSVVLLYGVLLAAVKRKYWALMLALAAVSIAVHLHYQAVVLAPFTFIAVLYFFVTAPKSRWWILGGFGFGLLITLPYLAAELSNNWHNTNAMIQYFTRDHAQYFDRVSKVAYISQFIPQFFERALAHELIYKGYVGLILLLSGFAALARAYQQAKPGQKHVVWVIVYYLCIIAMLRVYKGDKLDYYMSTLYTLPAVLCAALFHVASVLGTLVTFVCVSVALRAMLSIAPVNQFADLLRIMAATEAHFGHQDVRLMVHDDDYVNTFVFGLRHFTTVAINQKSRAVLEVYDQNSQPRTAVNVPCGESTSSDYYEQFWQTGGYQTLQRFLADDYAVDLATLQCEPHMTVAHPLARKNGTEGSDLLIPDIFETAIKDRP